MFLRAETVGGRKMIWAGENGSMQQTTWARQRKFRLAAAIASGLAVAALSPLGSQSAQANSELDVKNGQSNLLVSGSYTQNATPAAASDVTFSSSTTYNPTTFTVSGANTLSIGTLNDLDAAQSLTVDNGSSGTASTLTLNGGSDSVTGSASTDLIYVSTGGSLTVTNGSGSGTAMGVTLAAAGNLDIVGSASISSVLTWGANAIQTTGAGNLTLSGANSGTGGFTIGNGTLIYSGSNSTTLGTGTVTLGSGANNVLLTFTSSPTLGNNVTVAAGAGTRKISASANSGGGSVFSGGTITLNNNLAVAETSTGLMQLRDTIQESGGSYGVTVDATNTGTVDFRGASTFTGGVAIDAGTASFTSGSAGSVGSLTSGPFGTATITLGQTGGVTAAALVQGVNSTNGYTLGNAITVTSGGSRTIGQASAGATGAAVYTGPIGLNADLTLTALSTSVTTGTDRMRIGAGGITGSNNIIINNSNAATGAAATSGAIRLDGTGSASAWTGNLIVGTGQGSLGNNTATGSGNTVGVASGALFNFSGGGSFTPTIAGLANASSTALGGSTGGTVYSIQNSAQTLNLGGSGAYAFAGVIADGTTVITGATGTTALTVALTGSGSQTLSGANIYSGNTTLSSGTLNMNSTTAVGGAAGTININGGTIDNTSGGSITLANNQAITLGGNFVYSTSAGTANNNLNLGAGAVTNSGSRTITLNGAGTLTFGGVMTNTLAGANTLTVNNGTGTTSTSAVSFGGYALSSSSISYTDIINGSGNVNITGVVSNGGTATASGLTYGGTGTLTLSNAANTYSGVTTVSSGGTLSVATLANGLSNSSIGDSSNASANIILSNGTLSYTGLSVSIDRGFTYDATNGGTIAVTNAATNLQFAGIAAQSALGSSSLIKTGAGTLTLSGSADNSNFGLIVDAGEVDLNNSSGRVITRNGITINGGGIVKITGTDGDEIQNSQTVSVNNGTFNLNGKSETASNLTIGDGTDNGIISGGSGSTYTNSNGATGTFNAESGSADVILAGTGTVLNKTTSGIVSLTQSNTYSGGTLITAGTLLANNASGTSATGSGNVAVSGTGELGGNGKVSGAITLNGSGTPEQGGFIAAGANGTTVGTLTTGSQSWNGGGAYAWKINSIGTSHAAATGASSTLTVGSETNDDVVAAGLTVSTTMTPVDIQLLNTATPLASTNGNQYSWTIAKVNGAPVVNGTTLATTAGANNSGNLLSSSNSLAAGGAVFALDTSGFTIDGVSGNSIPPSYFSLEFVGNTAGTGENLVLDYSAAPEPGTMMLVLAGGLPMLTARRRRRTAVVNAE